MRKIFKKIVYDPVKARVVYDFAIALTNIFLVKIVFMLFSIPTIGIIETILYPITFLFFNYILGIYGRKKMAPVREKAVLLFSSVMLTFIVFFLINKFSLGLVIATLFILILAILPRVFFNLYNPSNQTGYFDNIIHSKLPILVVGGGGYIGSHVVERLLENNYPVRVFDKFIYGKEVLADLAKNKNLEIIEGDISDLFKLTLALNNVQAVIHLAGLVGDPACKLDEKLTRHMNVVSTRMMKETVKAFRIPKFIFASSCSVYGSSDDVVNEDSRLNPVSLYAQTKLDSEREILQDQFDAFHPTVLRFATVFGHSRKPRFDLVVNLFLAQAFNKGVITVTGSHQWRPFVHVSDVAEAIVKVIKAPQEKVSRRVFNVGDDRLNLTIGELAKLVAKVVGKHRKVKVMIKDDIADRRNYHVSFKKIKDELGFVASKTIKDGIVEMFEHFKKGTYKKPYRDPYYSNLEMTRLVKKEFDSEDYKRTHFSVITDKI